MVNVFFNVEPKAQTKILGHHEHDETGSVYIAIHLRAICLLYPDEDNFISKVTEVVFHEVLHWILNEMFPDSGAEYHHGLIKIVEGELFDYISPESKADAGIYDGADELYSAMYV